MKLNKVTKKWLKSFAGATIYQRGEGYFKSGMVYQMEYHPENLHIRAAVSGNYGNYEVNVSEEKQNLNAYCDCPYDGYPCKHIVAVLLNFIENKKEYIHQAKERTNFFTSLQEKLTQYPQEQLVKIIVEAAQHHPNFKRELVMMVEPENSETLDMILKQIRYIRLDDYEDNYGSDLEKIRELRNILKSIEKASGKIQAAVNWKVADKVLHFLNDYGISDERWEDLALQTFETLLQIFSEDSALNEQRLEVIKKLKEYYEWGNSAMTDDILEFIEELNQ